MKITLGEADRFGNYEIEAEDGRTIYIQTDLDRPGIASTFGWSPCHSETDGTVACPVCGKSALELISDATDYLDAHWGEAVEDPGYFPDEDLPPPHFDRFDICEAYACLEWDYNSGGIVWERPSNARRRMSTDVQLSRMKFRPRPNLSFDTLEENGKAIYRELERRYGFRK